MFKASRKKPGLTIHTQRTVVICQIQKAIATVNANAASWRATRTQSSGGSLARKKNMSNFRKKLQCSISMMYVFVHSGSGKRGISTLILDTDRNTPSKKPLEGFGCQNQQKRIQACSPFDFAATTLMYYVHIRHGHPHLEPCNGTLLLHS